ncbi:hypothetical protein D3C71_1690420 [compost metagenome]
MRIDQLTDDHEIFFSEVCLVVPSQFLDLGYNCSELIQCPGRDGDDAITFETGDFGFHALLHGFDGHSSSPKNEDRGRLFFLFTSTMYC